MKKYDEFLKINELMATPPISMKKVNTENTDKEILRLAIISELDAVSLYEQFSENATDEDLKKVLLDIAKEEKTHVGEFQALLKKLDPEYKSELKKGKKEVEDLSEDDEDEDDEKEDKEEKKDDTVQK